MSRSCARCGNHGEKSLLKGHKRYCGYKYCKCENCKSTEKKQKLMAVQTAARRAKALDEALLQTGPAIFQYKTDSDINISRIPDDTISYPNQQTHNDRVTGNLIPIKTYGKFSSLF